MELARRAYHLVNILGELGLLTLRAAFAPKPRALPSSVKKILIVGCGAIGDAIYFLPALRVLRSGFPDARITLIENRYPTTTEFLPAMGVVDDIWIVDPPSRTVRRRREILRRIRGERFDLALMSLVAPMRFLGPALLSIPMRVGHCRPIEAPHAGWSALRYALWRLKRGVILEEFERRLLLNRIVWIRDDQEHAVSRNLRLVQTLGLPVPRPEEAAPELPETASAKAFAQESLRRVSGTVIGLHLGSSQSQYGKIWPAERWGSVCAALARDHRFTVVLVGGSEELEAAQAFRSVYSRAVVDLVGRSNLMESFSVIRRCELFLGNDTGLTKASIALGISTVTVWGPTNPGELGAIWNPEKHLNIFRDLPCMPCVRMGIRQEGSGVINYMTCGHRACLRELDAATVAEAIRRRYGRLLGKT